MKCSNLELRATSLLKPISVSFFTISTRQSGKGNQTDEFFQAASRSHKTFWPDR